MSLAKAMKAYYLDGDDSAEPQLVQEIFSLYENSWLLARRYLADDERDLSAKQVSFFRYMLGCTIDNLEELVPGIDVKKVLSERLQSRYPNEWDNYFLESVTAFVTHLELREGESSYLYGGKVEVSMIEMSDNDWNQFTWVTDNLREIRQKSFEYRDYIEDKLWQVISVCKSKNKSEESLEKLNGKENLSLLMRDNFQVSQHLREMLGFDVLLAKYAAILEICENIPKTTSEKPLNFKPFSELVNKHKGTLSQHRDGKGSGFVQAILRCLRNLMPQHANFDFFKPKGEKLVRRIEDKTPKQTPKR